MRRPDLSDLDAFAAVAQSRNFRRAAVERGVSASTLSAAVRDLEERLGVRLLNRTTRSVTPTEAGRRLLARLQPLLGEVSEILDEVNGFRDRPAGRLRLNVPGVVADLLLPPVLPRFLAAYPDITLEIVAENSFIDVFAAGFDAGIRYEESLAQDMIAVPLVPTERYVLAAAPILLAREGLPRHPRDLIGRPCIRQRFASGTVLPWEFEKDGETVKIAPDGPLAANTVTLQRAAAEAGIGWIYTFEGFLAPALAAGTLVEVLPEWSLSFSGPYLYYPSRRHVPAALRAFVDFVKSRPWDDAAAAQTAMSAAATLRSSDSSTL